MSNSVTLASEHDSADLQVFLERADRLGCEHVRLIGSGKALAAYVAVLAPQGLLDVAPTVLGLRVFERAETDADNVDTVVQIRAVLDRLAHDRLSIPLPVGQPGVPWAAISPPRAGWAPVGEIVEAELQAIAEAGIEEVAKANGLGTNIVTAVREEVWQRPVQIMSADSTASIPAGAAFAAFGLGFLGSDSARVSSSQAWKRVTTQRGHVLVK